VSEGEPHIRQRVVGEESDDAEGWNERERGRTREGKGERGRQYRTRT